MLGKSTTVLHTQHCHFLLSSMTPFHPSERALGSRTYRHPVASNRTVRRVDRRDSLKPSTRTTGRGKERRPGPPHLPALAGRVLHVAYLAREPRPRFGPRKFYRPVSVCRCETIRASTTIQDQGGRSRGQPHHPCDRRSSRRRPLESEARGGGRQRHTVAHQ